MHFFIAAFRLILKLYVLLFQLMLPLVRCSFARGALDNRFGCRFNLVPTKTPTLYSGPDSESTAVSDEQIGLKHR